MDFTALSIESILHDYERLRLQNKRIREDRKTEIYAKIPEIEKLDNASKFSYLELMKRRINNQGENALSTADSKTKETNRDNTAKIHSLLKEHGYPEDYLDPIYQCPLCQDIGYADGEKCSCLTNRIIHALYSQSNLTKILEKENFNTFSLAYYRNDIPEGKNWQVTPYQKAKYTLEECKKFVDDFSQKPYDRGNMIIYGETGLGKTFLTNCIAKALLDQGHTVLYLSANDLFERVLGDYLINKKKHLEELYKYIYNSELLIIDDLGTETTNTFICSQLFEVINQRGLSGKSTIISTNLTLQEFQNRYSERIMSRIVANYAIHPLYGDNIRYQKRKEEG